MRAFVNIYVDPCGDIRHGLEGRLMRGEQVLKCVARKWGVIDFMWHAGRIEVTRKRGPAGGWSGAWAGGERIKQTQKCKPITLYANL